MFLTPLISAPVDISIMLIGAFLIGYGTAWLLRKQRITKLEEEELKLQHEIRTLHISVEHMDIAKDKLQDQLNECVESKSNLVRVDDVQQVTSELKQERERSETARRSLVEIENAHEALKQELQYKINQMLSQEEANKLRAEVNRLRVFNSTLEDELKEFKQRNVESDKNEIDSDHPVDVDSTFSHGLDFVSSIGIKAASSHERDDLKLISGVGPFIESKLNSLGIYTFNQIASMSSEQAEKINDAIEFFPGRILRDDWVSQAKRLGEQ